MIPGVCVGGGWGGCLAYTAPLEKILRLYPPKKNFGQKIEKFDNVTIKKIRHHWKTLLNICYSTFRQIILKNESNRNKKKLKKNILCVMQTHCCDYN
jgi:hypothetical protein